CGGTGALWRRRGRQGWAGYRLRRGPASPRASGEAAGGTGRSAVRAVGVQGVQGRLPAFPSSLGGLLPPGGAAFAQAGLGEVDPVAGGALGGGVRGAAGGCDGAA